MLEAIRALFSAATPSLIGDRRLIIVPGMLPHADGENINGPSLIRAPDWLPNRLGRYYLYFAHHKGRYIRLAYADDLNGPWAIHEPGTLHLSDAPGCRGHIASPDVHVDHARRRLVMYFHGPQRQAKLQKTFVAQSSDGIGFVASSHPAGTFYFRAFHHKGTWYAIAKGGSLHRSRDGLTGWTEGPDLFPVIPNNPKYNKSGSVRHVAVDLADDLSAWVYFSRIGDRPERIFRAAVSLSGEWLTWKAGDTVEEVARPVEHWEGARIWPRKSRPGIADRRMNELRDPCIFHDSDHGRYLLYSVAGEQGIAIAPLRR